jgi:ribonuclease E
MLISVDRDESRASVIEDGQLVHLEIEPVSRLTCKGNIYRAVVARVEPSLQSAFVDFGNDKQGFLPVGEIHPKFRGGNQDKRAPIQEILRSKTEMLVQVVRDEIGQKGATLSTFISLPGRYLVLIPENEKETTKAGVSRKLSDEARDRIKRLTETMKVPDGFGLIVRTAGETATELELQKDLLYLTRQWEHITKKAAEGTGPTLLYAERSLPVRFVRDYFTKDIEEVVIDDDGTLAEVSEFLQVLMPRGLHAVHRYAGDMPLFARYGMEGKVEDVFSRQVYLPSGGSIVIDQAEALVAIDVNSGRVKEKDIEETARATNMEAAQEIARQMILRDMGGLIVVDFIDMREKKYVREVEQALKDAFKHDKARTKLGHISEFGLLEMSRQRIKSSVNKGSFDTCPHCSGTGRMRSFESVAMSVLRRIYETCTQKRVRYVIAMVPPQTARYLLNSRRKELATLEDHYHLTIEVVAVDNLSAQQVVLEHLEDMPAETGTERADRLRLLRVTQELDLVRNHLVKREETRVQIETAAAKRGAKVDYAEIYKEVREMSPQSEPETGAAPHAHRRPPRRAHTDHQAPAAVETPAPVAEETYAPLPEPKGFLATIKSWFVSAPAPTPPPPVRTALPTAKQPVSEVPAQAPRVATPPVTAVAAPTPAAAPGTASADASADAAGRPPRDRRDRRDRNERRDFADRKEGNERPDRGERKSAEGEDPETTVTAAAGEDRNAERPSDRGHGRRDRHDGRRRDESERRPEVAAKPAESAEGEAAAETPAAVLADGETAGAPTDGRRRRRRRRRGGERTRNADGTVMAADGGAEGDDEGDDDELEAGAAPAQDGATNGAAADTDTTSAAADASAEPAVAAADTAVASEETAVAPDSVDVAAEAQSGATAVVAEEPVDLAALVEAEAARMLQDTAEAGAAAPVVEPAPLPVELKPGPRNKFVVDLRTNK